MAAQENGGTSTGFTEQMSAIEFIKQVRNTLGIGLSEAKELIEEFEFPDKAIAAWHQLQEQKHQEEEAREYVDPKSWKNHWYWKFRPVEEEDLEQLKMLTPNYCRQLWSKFVTEESDHLMRSDVEQHWKIRKVERVKGYNWETDSDENQLQGLGDFLNPYLNWNPEDVVYLFFGRYSGFQMTWELFLKYSHPLLFHSYGDVLVNVNDVKVVIFEEHGYVRIGERRDFLGSFQNKLRT